MKIEQVRKLKPIDRLAYWIIERESIRQKKERGEPRPWTDDEILRTYRFCNVRRMDDAVSRWLLSAWYKPHFDHPNMLLACTVARHFNKPYDTLKRLGFPHNRFEYCKHAKLELKRMKKEGLKVFNGAYIISGMAGKDKAAMVIDRICKPLITKPPQLDYSSMENSVNELKKRFGFGTFIAGQVIADLRHAVCGAWADRNTWAAIGPGSRRGMNILAGLDPNTALSQSAFTPLLQSTMIQLKKRLPESITSRLEAIDYQNCLCELFKAEKGWFGYGRPKQIYKPAV